MNLVDCHIEDYIDKEDFIDMVREGALDGAVEAVLHQGACSDTTERDGRYMMRNNYEYSKALLEFCTDAAVPFIYASSAAVYGARTVVSRESRIRSAAERIRLFEAAVRPVRAQARGGTFRTGRRLALLQRLRQPRAAQGAACRRSLFISTTSIARTGSVRLFEGADGYADGEQRRDFISVDDIVRVNLFFLDHPDASGIFNVGTGAAQSFNDVAVAAVNACRVSAGESRLTLEEMQRGRHHPLHSVSRRISQGKYQSYTQADISALARSGLRGPFSERGARRRRVLRALITAARGQASEPPALLRKPTDPSL